MSEFNNNQEYTPKQDSDRIIIINQAPQPVARRKNGMGVAGFVLAFIFPPLGFIFSFIGVFKAPRGMAIAGLILSIVFSILWVIWLGLLGSYM